MSSFILTKSSIIFKLLWRNKRKSHSNLNQVTLEYSGTGSDIDLDENGNVFYTGYAGNGTNTSGVSIYKKSNSGTPTLVGNDNLLKSGTVVKLRVLMGKVYIAVTAKQSGKEVYQISIIKENWSV